MRWFHLHIPSIFAASTKKQYEKKIGIVNYNFLVHRPWTIALGTHTLTGKYLFEIREEHHEMEKEEDVENN